MCGICFILGGASIHSHSFGFNFFQPYLCKTNVPLNQHIIQNKTILPAYFEPDKIINKLKCRGPDKIKIDQIDMFKVNHQEISEEMMKDNQLASKGEAFGFQSILHLRGQQMYLNSIPGSYLLFNGEIWNTGNFEQIEVSENDTAWLHKKLVECKGSRQKMHELLKQLRGDFAFVFVEGDEIFIGKDYFGKRSLLIGMGEDYFVISSIPIHDSKRIIEKNEQNQDDPAGQEQNEESWKLKYQAEWLSAKDKYYFEIPANSYISASLKKDGIFYWDRINIHDIELAKIQKNLMLSEENIIGNVKKLLIECLREITHCIHNLGNLEHQQTKICVLFSGGIDSTLIARMLDFVLPKNQVIDLVNLSFRADAPDREAGLTAYKQLVNLSPQRKYNLILLDKTLEDIEANKGQLMELIYPKSTHMDFNIAAALNIAVTGTKSRIILTGLGADEIFSGYSRYRIAYKRAGLAQLQNQMIFDMERLWIRNLGRDDRSIGNRGKQVRYPFLYLPLWTYLREVPVNKITEGSGQKMLLRKIAKEFGLDISSTFKKRAIQFGTRLAKLSNVKCFGSNRKAKGTYEYK